MEHTQSASFISFSKGFCMVKYSAFSYKKGNSLLHKCPSWIKLLFLPILNVLFLCLPPYFAFGLIAIQFLTACVLRISVKEQFRDLKPVLYYASLLIFFQFFVSFSEGEKSFKGLFNWSVQKESVFSLAKLFCVMQSASLLFKTSTSLELREGIGAIERNICKFLHAKKTDRFTNAIFLFLNFIPMISRIWQELKLAWISRNGKNSIKMYAVLLPVFFSVGMKKAYNQAKAIQIRN